MSHLLDTCVISELVRPEPNKHLLQWFSEQDEDGLFLSVLTIGELERGIEKLAASRKRTKLAKWVREDLARRFDGRVLSIDMPVARRWGVISGASERKGKPLPVIDSLIAATAIVHDLTVVSRNVPDFERCGVECLSPWQAA